MVWSCLAWRYQFPNTWGSGTGNNWEKEEELINEIMERVHKEGFGIWLENRGCIQSEKKTRAN